MTKPKNMPNVHTLRDIENKEVVECSLSKHTPSGHRLGSIREIELEKALRGSIETASDIANDYKDLQDIHLKRVKDFNRICSGLNNKFSRLNTANTELEAKYTAEIQSLKSKIKTLKREGTLAQKASSADKVQILSLETKIRELEGELEDLKSDPMFHDSDVIGGMIEEPAQINSSDPKEIDSLRLELEQVRDNLSSKKYEIECMEKGIESSKNIYNQTIDSLFSARSNLLEVNRSLREQLALKKNNEIDHPPPPMNNSSCIAPSSKNPSDSSQPSSLNPSSQIISVGGAEAISLPATTPIITNSLISSMLIYSILTLVLIAIIWFMVRKWWNSWKKSNQYSAYEKNLSNYIIPNPIRRRIKRQDYSL